MTKSVNNEGPHLPVLLQELYKRHGLTKNERVIMFFLLPYN